VTTPEHNITKDMTLAEAANLLATLQKGDQAAWRTIYEVPWHSAEYESRLQAASEVDGVFL
jgi:hypothetical protein